MLIRPNPYSNLSMHWKKILSPNKVHLDIPLHPSYFSAYKLNVRTSILSKDTTFFTLFCTMKTLKRCIIGIFLSGQILLSFGQEELASTIIAKGASLQLISDDFMFTEGPAVDTEGNIYFTDQPKNRIWKYSNKGFLTIYMAGANRANGLYIDQDGNILACADLHNQLIQVSPTKKVSILVDEVGGKQLNGPNDLWVDPAGGIYFTDPYYKRKYWHNKRKEIAGEHVYYLPPTKDSIVCVVNSLVKPNGIVGTPDGFTLYVADIQADSTFVFDIMPGGALANKRLFIAQGSDGMTIDREGNVYLTGRKGLTVVNPSGKIIEEILIDQPWTANVVFGGKKRNTLFITASEAIYTLKMKVKGVKN